MELDHEQNVITNHGVVVLRHRQKQRQNHYYLMIKHLTAMDKQTKEINEIKHSKFTKRHVGVSPRKFVQFFTAKTFAPPLGKSAILHVALASPEDGGCGNVWSWRMQ